MPRATFGTVAAFGYSCNNQTHGRKNLASPPERWPCGEYKIYEPSSQKARHGSPNAPESGQTAQTWFKRGQSTFFWRSLAGGGYSGVDDLSIFPGGCQGASRQAWRWSRSHFRDSYRCQSEKRPGFLGTVRQPVTLPSVPMAESSPPCAERRPTQAWARRR